MEDKKQDVKSLEELVKTADSFRQRMQALLDEISDFRSAIICDLDESINPFVDLEED